MWSTRRARTSAEREVEGAPIDALRRTRNHGRDQAEARQGIAALPQGTVVCNEYALGGWLILDHPNVRPAFDPRTELFTIDYIDTSIAFTRATPGWQRLPVITGCRYAIQPSNSARIGVLTTEANWQVLGSDRGYTMLAAP